MKTIWDELSIDYSRKVYSITREKMKRERILNQLNDSMNILILGSGCEEYLQKDILEKYPNSKIVCSDISSMMNQESKIKFNHKHIRYVEENMLFLNYHEEFDVVITTNSILMNNVLENDIVFENIYKSLKKGGKQISYLPAFDSLLFLIQENPSLKDIFPMNEKEQYLEDAIDGTKQSFHTVDSIRLANKKYQKLTLMTVSCSETKDEFNHIHSLYKDILSIKEVRNIFEYFLVAVK